MSSTEEKRRCDFLEECKLIGGLGDQDYLLYCSFVAWFHICMLIEVAVLS
jgi:hypothetical protein